MLPGQRTGPQNLIVEKLNSGQEHYRITWEDWPFSPKGINLNAQEVQLSGGTVWTATWPPVRLGTFTQKDENGFYTILVTLNNSS